MIKEGKGKENLVQVSGESRETNVFRTNLVLSCLSISPVMGVSCLPRYKPLITGSFLIFIYPCSLDKVLCLTNKSYLLVCSVL